MYTASCHAPMVSVVNLKCGNVRLLLLSPRFSKSEGDIVITSAHLSVMLSPPKPSKILVWGFAMVLYGLHVLVLVCSYIVTGPEGEKQQP